MSCPAFKGNKNKLKSVTFDFANLKRRNYVAIDLNNPTKFSKIIPTNRRLIEFFENDKG